MDTVRRRGRATARRDSGWRGRVAVCLEVEDMHRTPRPYRLPLLLLLLGLALAPAAVADDAPALVPNVVGKSAEQAQALLDDAGFHVVAIDIAEGEAGKVHSQVPPGGSYRAPGDDVEIRIGTALRVETVTPDTIGKALDAVIDDYASAYVIEVEAVEGEDADQGKVLDQDPKPGDPLLFRGVLRLFAVQASAPAGVTVPAVIGMAETEARAALEDAGLSIAITYVQDPVAGPGIVVSQDPPCCGEILAGGLVALRVNGEPPDEPDEAVPMPAVTGLTMHDASNAVLMEGLVPQVQFQVAGGEAWRVIQQDPAAGVLVPAGGTVGLVVSLPTAQPTQVRVPPLYGLTAADAVAVLGGVHLTAHVVEQYSLYTPGRVYGQSPVSGAWIQSGSTVTVQIARTPPGGWTPTGVVVPSVTGRSPTQAFVRLLAAGLWGHQKLHVSPDAPIGVIDHQHPAAGAVVGPGTIVSIYLPKETTVPPLVGSTTGLALTKLTQAGLNGHAQGPGFGLGATKVTSQAVAAGTKIARGTTIPFTFVYTGGIGPLKVKVPALVGKTKAQAAALLQGKGLNAHFVGPVMGIGPTKVTSQSPVANTLVLAGSTVTVHYVHTGGITPLKVQVPNVVGKSKGQAGAALQAKGLTPHFIGPAFGFGATQVTSQSPAAGTLAATGTTVDVHYTYSGGIQLPKVQVPTVVGLSKAQAAALLQSKGLQAQFVGPALGFGIAKVVSQTPGANTLVLAGSTVQATIQYTGGVIGLKVPVPNLINMSKAQALTALQAKGLVANFHGPQLGFGTTKVVSQSPGAGTLVAKGSHVNVNYVFASVISPPLVIQVAVPNVVGKTKGQAKAMIEAKGLKAKFVGLPFGIGKPRVLSQNPPAGHMVLKNAVVTMHIKWIP